MEQITLTKDKLISLMHDSYLQGQVDGINIMVNNVAENHTTSIDVSELKYIAEEVEKEIKL